MKKALRQQTHRVHFGEAEDFLATSFFNDGVAQVPDDEKSEEEKKKEEINSRVVQALSADDVSMLKHLQVEIPDLVDTYLDRPLAHLAAEHGALKILQECVSKPADSINAASADFEATTPLFWAIREGHADVVDWLLSNGAFHQPLNVYQDSAVYVAVYYDQTELLDVLQAHRCDCNIPNRNGDLPLIHAISKSNIKALDKLIEMGVDIYGGNGNKWGSSSIEFAIQMYSQVEVINRLISAGFDVNKKPASEPPHKNSSPLEFAVTFDNLEAVKTILPHVTCQETLSNAVDKAIRYTSLPVVKLLVEAGANVDINKAIRMETQDILKYLLQAGISVQGKCALYRCVYYGTLRTQKFETASCRTNNGCLRQREILYSTHAAYRSLLQELMEYGADLDEVYSETGVTALRHSAAGGMVCMTLDLLRAGCNPSILDNHGRTALRYTIEDCSNPFLSSNKRRRLTAVAAILAEFTPYFAEEHHVAPCLLPANLHEELSDLIKENSSAPRLLQHLCRWAILQMLKPRSHVKVHLLGLPQRLVDYLLLEDLCDLNNYYADKLKPALEDFCYFHRVLDPILDKGASPSACECDPTGLNFACKLT